MTEGDKLLEDAGFELIEEICTPIPDVNESAKQYHYKRVQSDVYLIFDTQQNGISMYDEGNPVPWYSLSDFEAITTKAKELGMI